MTVVSLSVAYLCGGWRVQPRVLKVREVRRFELLWTDRGIGKGIWDGALYRPLPDEGYTPTLIYLFIYF
jgi:hypothetical protein